MMDRPHITTGGTAYNRTLGRVGLAAAVLLATVVVGAGFAAAAPVGAAPAMDEPNETAARPTMDIDPIPVTAGPSPRPEAAGSASTPGDFNYDESLRMEVVDINEERIVVEVQYPNGNTFDEIKPQNDIYLRPIDEYTISGTSNRVPVPEETDRFAAPVETRAVTGREGHWILTFRTGDIDLSEEDGQVTLGVGDFPDGERTVPGDSWDTDTVSIVTTPFG